MTGLDTWLLRDAPGDTGDVTRCPGCGELTLETVARRVKGGGWVSLAECEECGYFRTDEGCELD